MAREPMLWCYYDRCCQFQPGSHNSRYCQEHKCKRKLENSVKRVSGTPQEGVALEAYWKLQENKKISNLDTAQNKNKWLLEKSSFGFFDLETTNLDASIGMILCACLKTRGGDTITYVTGKDKDGMLDDKQLCIELRDDLEKFDYVSGYYSTKFDVPYLNTRLIINGERPINQLRHIDVYYTARFKLKLHSNRLQVVAETLFDKSQKTRVVGPIWTRAAQGSKKDMQYIISHCIADVAELEDIFNTLVGFVNLSAVRWRRYGASY